MLRIIDDSISVPVAKFKLVVDEGLEAHVIVDNVVQAVQLGRGKLKVFPRVARIADFSFSVICGPAFQEVKHVVIDYILIERSQLTLQIKRGIFRFVVLEKLLETDFIIIIEVHHLENSNIFCSVRTTQTDISYHGLVFLVFHPLILWAHIHVFEVLFT